MTFPYHHILIALCFAVLANIANAQQTITNSESSYAPYRIAVADFSVNDISGQLEDTVAIAGALQDAFELALIESGRFDVVTRDNLDSVLEEIALSQSGIVASEQAIELGQLMGAELLVTGSLTYDTEFLVNINFVNVITGAIDAAASLSAIDEISFNSIARELCTQAGDAYAPKGTVVAIGQRTFIDLGSESGVGRSRTGSLVREVLVEGLRFNETVGRFSISSLGPEASTITVDLEPNMRVQVGDIAVLDTDFNFDVPTINNMNRSMEVDQYFANVIVGFLGDSTIDSINIFTAEGDLVAIASPFTRSLLVPGNYIATPYGADAYDRSPAVPFTVEAGQVMTVELDLSSIEIREHTDAIDAIAYTPAGDRLITGGRDGRIIIRDVYDASVQKIINLHAPISHLAISRDGQYLAASVGGYGEAYVLHVWALDESELVLTFETDSLEVTALAFSADDSLLYFTDAWEDVFYHIAVDTGDIVLSEELSDLDIVDLNVDSGLLFAENYTDSMLDIYDVTTGAVVTSFVIEDISSIVSNANQSFIALAEEWEVASVHIYSFTGEYITHLRGGSAYDVDALEFTPEGDRLVAAVGRELYVWDIPQQKIIETFFGHTHFITALAISPDATTVVASDLNKALHQWALGE